ncbi:sigma-70 family RNA polymerase sigma factor [Pseudofrankia asymbiotica]|uniref:RNA polymerase sigma factor n=1 Tax=Pseudofrankia asymbiotica TaxID=1834516 RepID=A0A1V2IJ27_9ACTN|nr:sigma-70 family RNA polymerase sigma factor [Pseudofrankia asymbiotica]ONH32431.1 RNA polymerase subunit sigma-70 [Pseudofrankia asymbiotica]
MTATVLPAVDRDDFLRDAEAYRAELLAHCYKMVGSLHEAEDLVQETYLRAWRAWGSFEGRSSVRAWLYRIATNVCLTALRQSPRRVLPSGLGVPGQDPDVPMPAPAGEVLWLEPFPDLLGGGGDPAEVVAARSSLRLALVASLQHLPARQRAVFILREALAFPATEVADMLNMSVAAVKSALQRARARLDEVAASPETLVEPDSPAARAVLDRFMTAFERADVGAMTDLLRADASLEVVPLGRWLPGKRACLAHLAGHVLTTPGRYLLYPVVANGQPAAVAYRRRQAQEPHLPFGVTVLRTDGHQVTRITTFVDPALVRLFGFPDTPPEV